jgi:predicted lipoprotein with Yx(FWY)xxD motif
MPVAILVTTLLVSGAVLLAGCGGQSAAAPSAGGSRPPAQAIVRARVVPGLGRVLVDREGYVLYAYLPDHHRASTCYGECARVWPPLLATRGAHPAGGPGVRRPLLGTTRRRNGSLQVTYDHRPLYLYERDRAPGDASGQGSTMGLWYAVAADGSIDRREPADQGG